MTEERCITISGSDGEEYKSMKIHFNYLKDDSAVTFVLKTNWYPGKKINEHPEGIALFIHTTDPKKLPDAEPHSHCTLLGDKCYNKILSDGKNIADNLLKTCSETYLWFELERVFKEHF